jgi:hypothetical protein
LGSRELHIVSSVMAMACKVNVQKWRTGRRISFWSGSVCSQHPYNRFSAHNRDCHITLPTEDVSKSLSNSVPKPHLSFCKQFRIPSFAFRSSPFRSFPSLPSPSLSFPSFSYLCVPFLFVSFLFFPFLSFVYLPFCFLSFPSSSWPFLS